jgi:hypothetical protein
MKSLIDDILSREQDASKDLLTSLDVVQAPCCSLDLETHCLLMKRLKEVSRAQTITKMVRLAKLSISEAQLLAAITLVTRKRSRGNFKYFRSRIGRGEMEILNAISSSMGTKTVRVLEAVLFLLCRLDPEVSRQR